MTKAEALEAIIAGVEAYQRERGLRGSGGITPVEIWRAIEALIKEGNADA